jgi:hypothetical protein
MTLTMRRQNARLPGSPPPVRGASIPFAAVIIGVVGLVVASLYQIQVVLPCVISGVLLAVAGVCYTAAARSLAIPPLSLSNVLVVCYLYVGGVFVAHELFSGEYFSVHSRWYQTDIIIERAGCVTLVGFLAFLAGWYTTMARKSPRESRRSLPGSFRGITSVGPHHFWWALCLWLPCLILSMPAETVLTNSYSNVTNSTRSADLQLNAIKPASYLLLFLAAAAYQRRPVPRRALVLIICTAVGLILPGFAAGNRVEELGGILAIVWIIQKPRRRPFAVRQVLLVTAPLVVGLILLGEIRNTFSTTGDALSGVSSGMALVPFGDTVMGRPSTNGDAAVTLCTTIGVVLDGRLDFDYGLRYFRYLQMTLPRFLNKNRPMEMATELQQYSETGGGYYIINEPYLSGGALGVLVLMGTIGAACGSLERRCRAGQLGRWAELAYGVALAGSVRCVLYGTFTLYKEALVAVLAYAALMILGGPIGKPLVASRTERGRLPGALVQPRVTT